MSWPSTSIESVTAFGPGSRSRPAVGLGSIVTALLVLTSPAGAIDLEKIVMPGPLSQAHADLESECSNCHRAFDRASQRPLCLACHEEIAEDVDARVGFHGQRRLALEGECRSCHTEHAGRDGDIRGLGHATFDHAETDFELLGAHTGAACADCHLPETPRREAPARCFACHEADDAHAGSLGEDCARCHEARGWKKTGFDHDETDFPLTGRHAKAACIGCHVGQQYENTPSDCVSCHAIDDVHEGRFGRDCGSCHDTKGFAKKTFDHEAESGGFALVGAHAEAECSTCHREAPGKRKLPEGCADCHGRDDSHAGRFGTNCADCHTPSGWKRGRFDHARRTDFALRGAHASLACETCHAGPAAQLDGRTACIDCHRKDDVHAQKLGEDCASCHNEASFDDRITFDHDLTEFPLLGLHAMTPCEQCHSSLRYHETQRSCVGCHEADDVHERTLGPACGDCHNPNAWNLWRFDHDRQTDFALHGRHEALACAACHVTPTPDRPRRSQRCMECHRSDDAHRGGFGRRCENCHGFEAWTPAKIERR